MPAMKATAAEIKKNDPRILNGWALFDWANSAFALVISVAVFPGYFETVVADQVRILGWEISSSSLLTFTISLSYLLIAAASPFLSGISDYGGRRKGFLKLFTTAGGVACLFLYFFTGTETLWIGLPAFMIGLIGFAGGLVFYNSFLPLIATEDRYDSVSARGFAMGYIGSVLLLIVNLAMLQFPASFGLPEASTLPARLSFVSVGVWWLVFASISLARLPNDERKAGPLAELAGHGWQELVKIWHNLQGMSQAKRFLLAFFCYSAGVQTVLLLASLFGSRELGFETSELIVVVLILQIVAIGGAYLFSFISKLRGNIFSLLVCLGIWLVICVLAYFVQGKTSFYAVAGAVGLVMGGVQSMSRSTYSKFLPENTPDTASYFSFYDVLEKVSIVLGTFLFGLLDVITGSMRLSMLMLAVFFVGGMILLGGIKMSGKRTRQNRKGILDADLN